MKAEASAGHKKILLSGVKPTGRPHLGNYFGAMKQFVDLQNDGGYEPYIFVADYHALTTLHNGQELSENTLAIALDYLAIGLDPEKTTLYKQSDLPEVAELAWIFNCITTMPYLERAHAYKDAAARGRRDEISVGTFDYPLLMAADILIQDADVVPVGADQKQHIEYARDTAEKFNFIFCRNVFKKGADNIKKRSDEPALEKIPDIFRPPAPLLAENVKTVPGTDGEKMSKSYGNTIPLFGSDEEIKKLVMGIVTDSSAGVPKNVRAIHELLRPAAALDALYAEKKGKYQALKEALAADLIAFVKPLREKRERLAKDKKAVLEILKAGGARARARAAAKMRLVRQRVGTAGQ